VVEPWTRPFLAVCPDDGRCITHFQIIVTALFGSASRAPEDTASSIASPQVYCPVLYRWRREYLANRLEAPPTAENKHCCMVQTPVNMYVENDPGLVECQGNHLRSIHSPLLLVTHWALCSSYRDFHPLHERWLVSFVIRPRPTTYRHLFIAGRRSPSYSNSGSCVLTLPLSDRRTTASKFKREHVATLHLPSRKARPPARGYLEGAN